MSSEPDREEWGAADPDTEERGQPEVDLVGIAAFALRNWRSLLLVPAIAAITVIGLSLALPKQYTASTSFIISGPQPSLSSVGGFANLARQFGIGADFGGATPQFYAQLATSRTIMDEILTARFPVPREDRSGADSAQLISILEISADNPDERLELGREELRERIGISTDDQTGVVSISATFANPELAAAAANRYISLLNNFNYHTRTSTAQEKREFIDERLLTARAELADAESEMSEFLATNRTFQTSPRLQMEFDRLQRQVLLKQEVLGTLARELEQARIEEVNDVPLLTVIDYAVPPVEYSFPKPMLFGMLAFLLTASMGFAVAAVRARTIAAEEPDRRLSSAWVYFTRDVRSALHLSRP